MRAATCRSWATRRCERRDGDGDKAQKLRDRIRKTIYGTAAHKRDLLRQSLAVDCRLEAVDSNLNATRQFDPQQPEGYNVNGSATLRIKLK